MFGIFSCRLRLRGLSGRQQICPHLRLRRHADRIVRSAHGGARDLRTLPSTTTYRGAVRYAQAGLHGWDDERLRLARNPAITFAASISLEF